MKARLEAARYLTWKACDYFDRTGGAGTEIAVLTKIFSSEAAVQVSKEPDAGSCVQVAVSWPGSRISHGRVCHDPRLPGHVCHNPRTTGAGPRGMGATTPVYRGMCATTPKRVAPPGACSPLRVTP